MRAHSFLTVVVSQEYCHMKVHVRDLSWSTLSGLA